MKNLFKGKTLEGNWIQGDLITPNESSPFYFIQNKKGGNQPVIENTTCQAIGKTDKNGKEVFLGDKVIISNKEIGVTRKGIVIYENCAFVVQIETSMLTIYFKDIDEIEIIGNIHD